MSYPVSGYRDATSRSLPSRGFQQPRQPTPPAWSPPKGPANDNIPRPSNDNFRPDGLAKAASKFRNYNGVFGNVFEKVIEDAILNAMNLLPGYATPLPPNLTPMSNFGGLPLYVLWEVAPADNSAQETAFTIGVRKTGQSNGAPGYGIPETHNLKQVVSPGNFYTTYRTYKAGPPYVGFSRMDQLAGYGPAPATTTVLMYGGNPVTGLVPTMPFPVVPWNMIPLKPLILPVNVYDAGNNPDYPPDHPLAPPVAPPASPPFTPRRPPPPGTKERKVKASKGAMGLLHFLGALTEGADAIEAFWDALPKEYQTKGANPIQQSKDLYQHWDKVNLQLGLFNLVWENIVADRAYGMLGVPTKPFGRMYGSNMGVNRMISDVFGDDLGHLLHGANQFTREQLAERFGLDLT